MLAFVLAFVASFVATFLIIRSSTVHGHLSHDHDEGPQKIHAAPVPRIGGIGIVVGVVTGLGVLALRQGVSPAFVGLLGACAAPAFVGGVTEDFTKQVSASRRLLITAFSAFLGAWLLDGVIRRTGLAWLDTHLAQSWGLGCLLAVFAICGVTNSVNIIDGFNGLSSMCVTIMLTAIGFVAFEVGDYTLVACCAACAGAVLGFFAWNFPAGLIFLGDGGAYFIGFVLAELGVQLIGRNAAVSPMFPLLVCIYPVFETVFSIYRRRFIRKVSPGVPDGVHLHHLVFKRMMRWTVGREDAKLLTRRNSMTSPYLWALCLFSVFPAVLFWDETLPLVLCIVGFGVLYSYLYWRIVRFRAPRWLTRKP